MQLLQIQILTKYDQYFKTKKQKVMTSGICSNQKAVFLGGGALSQNNEYSLKTLLWHHQFLFI